MADANTDTSIHPGDAIGWIVKAFEAPPQQRFLCAISRNILGSII